MKNRWPAAVLIGFCACANLYAFNGIAATIVYKMTAPGPVAVANTFRLVVSQVTNSAVTRQDTILRTDAQMSFPAISPDGKHIAFFKDNAGVCVVNINGDSLRVAAKTINWGTPDNTQSLAWPSADGAKWIYYFRPCNTGCKYNNSGEIWKVNVLDTTQNILVCDYTRLNDESGVVPPFLGKWSLSTDAKYCVIHTNGTKNSLGYDIGIIPHTFPPQCNPGTTQINPWLTTTPCDPTYGCAYRGACNSGLSAGGNIIWHFDGGHVRVYSWLWNHTTNTAIRYATGTPQGGAACVDMYLDMAKWLPAGTPFNYAGVVYPRGGCNSDQILTVQLEWTYGASHTGNGGDMIVVNWKEKKAILATNNPNMHILDNWPAKAGVPFWNVDPADFWVSGGPAGCYQNIDGNWISITNGQQVSAVNAPRISTIRNHSITGSSVSLYRLNGSRMSASSAHQSQNHHGIYIAANRINVGQEKVMLFMDNTGSR